MPMLATSTEKEAVVLNDSTSLGSSNSCLKLARPTNSTEVPKASCCCNDCSKACAAGQKKNTRMTASCGVSSNQGSQPERKTTRFSIPPQNETRRTDGLAGGEGSPGTECPADVSRQPLFAFWKRSSCSLPRLTMVSSASWADFLPFQTCSSSSSSMARTCT